MKEKLKQMEGRINRVYFDTEGHLTVGYGHKDNSLKLGAWIEDVQIEKWFDEDIQKAIDGYNSLDLKLSGLREEVVIMMVYQLGLSGVKEFRRFLGHLKAHDYAAAVAEGLLGKDNTTPSLWRQQTPNRCHRMMCALLTGVWV